MHALNGNTRLLLNLYDGQLSGTTQLSLENSLGLRQIQDHTAESTNIISREVFLRNKPKSVTLLPNPILTTTPIQCIAHSATPQRTGRRKKLFNKEGQAVFWKPKKPSIPIKEFMNSNRRSPPPRGAPGVLTENHEECTHDGRGTTGQASGSTRRCSQRRAYRQWKSQPNNERETGLGPPLLVPAKPQQATRTRAAWFRHTLFWQEQLKRRKGRKVKNLPTTTLLGSASSVRFGAINVQGFADT